MPYIRTNETEKGKKMEELKNKIEEAKKLLDNWEYDVIGLRYHRGAPPAIGERVPCSFVWDDGNITEEQLPGTSCLDLANIDPEKAIEEVKAYCWGEGELIIIAGSSAEGGNDVGEIIIHDAVRIF